MDPIKLQFRSTPICSGVTDEEMGLWFRVTQSKTRRNYYGNTLYTSLFDLHFFLGSATNSRFLVHSHFRFFVLLSGILVVIVA
ncbi:hypothetical protein Pfo_009507 [Paulownia fortunei]|nr:hypothetical protein Pfo_009507 [Paulownia fortunei]